LLALASEASGQREQPSVAAPAPRVAVAPLGGAAALRNVNGAGGRLSAADALNIAQ
jgi:hypothetical protein